MQKTFNISPIGYSQIKEGKFIIELEAEYRSGLSGLSDFSHAIALWWAHSAAPIDDLTISKPYTATPKDFGVFSTRSQARPNPIGVSVFTIQSIDEEQGLISSHYFDMLPQTPIIDIKPYFPASDSALSAKTPSHFDHWPKSLEESATFDWEKEFTQV